VDERRAAMERSDDPEESNDPGVTDGPLSASQLPDPTGP
jgi:hypothetical protein